MIRGILCMFFSPLRRDMKFVSRGIDTAVFAVKYRTGKGLFARKLSCSTNVYTQKSVILLGNHSKSSFLAASLRSFHCLQKERTLVSFVSVVLQRRRLDFLASFFSKTKRKSVEKVSGQCSMNEGRVTCKN